MKRRDVFKSLITGVVAVAVTRPGAGSATVNTPHPLPTEPSHTFIKDQPIISRQGLYAQIDEMRLMYRGKEISSKKFSEVCMTSGNTITITFRCNDTYYAPDGDCAS
jgi:hypothetical protein